MSEITNPFEKFESLKALDITDEFKLKREFEKLFEMELASEEQVLEFQEQRDQIEKHCFNEEAECYFLTTTDVANKRKKKRREHYEQVLLPIIKSNQDKLNRKFLESPAGQKLGAPYHILRRNQESKMAIFRPENIQLAKEIDRLCMEITEIQGKLTADWQGKKLPLPAIRPYSHSTDPTVRKAAYDCVQNSYLTVCDGIDQKFDRLLELRRQIAHNAGFDSYTGYRFKELERFDWNESHCFEFHMAVREYILPLRDQLLAQRKENLHLNKIRPYDTMVDILGREPLFIYEKGDSSSLIGGTGKVIKAIDDELYDYFTRIRDNNFLDLDSRENKAPGGYMLMYPIYSQASIFYNGVGLASDLMVLLHELGHCFHYFLSKDIAPYALQELTPEVAEAGSMSMEFIGLENLHHYLDQDKCQRIKEDKLREIIGFFPFCAQVDEFQHWIYANPGHSSTMRRDKWIELCEIYGRGVDRSGYEEVISKVSWQFCHVLEAPYYFIDYAISELLALTIWDRYKKNPKDGIAHYKQGCAIGASKAVPQIYHGFGTKLSFGKEVIAPLAERLRGELGL